MLVIDGNGSCQKALLGEQLAILAIENGWEGVTVNGAVRDVAMMAQMDLGIQALGSSPFKAEKHGVGQVNVTLTVYNQLIQPGDYIC